MALWRLSFMFQGKDMEDIMLFLSDQKVLNVEGPVRAVEVDERPLLQILVEDVLKDTKQISREQIKDECAQHGRGGASSYTYYAKQLMERGYVKPSKVRGVYTVTGQKWEA